MIRSCLLTFCVLSLAPPAFAQPGGPVDSAPVGASRWVDMRARVADTSGCTITARIAAIDAVGVKLTSSVGDREVPWASIEFVQQEGDSLVDGAVIGAVTGLAIAPLAAQGYSNDRSLGRAVAGTVLAYALIGAGIDALNKGWTTVYLKRGSRPPSSATRKKHALWGAAIGATLGAALAAEQAGAEAAPAGLFPGALIGAAIGLAIP